MEHAFNERTPAVNSGSEIKSTTDTSDVLPIGFPLIAAGDDGSAGNSQRPVINILLIGGSETDNRKIELMLSSRKCRFLYELDFGLTVRMSATPGIEKLAQSSFDAVLLDLGNCDSFQMGVVARIVEATMNAPVIVMADDLSLPMTVRSLRLGAEDSLDKRELTSHHLASSILHAIERYRRCRAESQLRLVDADQRAAGMVQALLLPTSPPQVTGLSIAGSCCQADHVGGDYYDFFHLIGDQFGFVLADVSSHGFTPALIMAGLRRLLRTLAQTTADIGAIVTLANHAILEDTLDTQFVTLFFGSIDVSAGTMQYVAAGHPGYLVTMKGAIVGLHDAGLPLGIQPTTYLTSEAIPVDEFEMLFAITDGYTEALNDAGDVYGIERVAALVARNRLRSPDQIIDALARRVTGFRGDVPQTDDCAAVVVKFGRQSRGYPLHSE